MESSRQSTRVRIRTRFRTDLRQSSVCAGRLLRSKHQRPRPGSKLYAMAHGHPHSSDRYGVLGIGEELGTEEQLLTLPITEVDIIIGKWLAIMSYFSLALICSLSNVAAVLARRTRSRPCLRPVFRMVPGGRSVLCRRPARKLLGGLPAVAFVVGILLCGFATLIARLEWLDAFDRGVISVGQIGVASAFTAVVLAASSA